MDSSPAIFVALSLLSPAITSKVLSPTSLTKIGDKTPCFCIELASSDIFSLLKSCLGWNLPGVISDTGISFTDLKASPFVSPKKASKPLFKAF